MKNAAPCQALMKLSVSEENVYKKNFIDSIKKLPRENTSEVMCELLHLLKPYAKKDPKLRNLLDEIADTILKEMQLL